MAWLRVLLWVLLDVHLILDILSSSAVAQTLTSDPTGTVFCNGSEVIFTCETRGSTTLEWHDGFYLGSETMQIGFVATIHDEGKMETRLNNNTVATLTKNYMDGNDTVLESTLSIIAQSDTPSDSSDMRVKCVRDDGNDSYIDFQVLAPPAVPQNVVSFQLAIEHVQNMCFITSVLQTSTNPANSEANVTNYTVNVDGTNVPYTLYDDIISTDRIKHSSLLYESSCGAHRIIISANSKCGQSPGTDVVMLDPNKRFILNVTAFDGASNIEGSVTAVVTGVVLVTLKHLLELA